MGSTANGTLKIIVPILVALILGLIGVSQGFVWKSDYYRDQDKAERAQQTLSEKIDRQGEKIDGLGGQLSEVLRRLQTEPGR